MMAKLSDSAWKRARLVPSAVFASPQAVVQADMLSRAQKIQVLRRWQFDLRPSGRSPTAGNNGPDSTDMLIQLRVALAALGADEPAAERGRVRRPTRH